MEGESVGVALQPGTTRQCDHGPFTGYPGLVQPYSKGNSTSSSLDRSVIEQAGNGGSNRLSPAVDRSSTTDTARMNQPRGRRHCDPFSIYDDDCGEDHYYLMPKMAPGSMRNEWNKTVKNSRSMRTLKAYDVKLTDSKGRTRSFPPCGQRLSSSKAHGKDFAKDTGEYCSISATEKNPPGLRTPLRSVRSLHGCKDRESLREFASRLVVNDVNENQASRHSLHSFEQRKTRAVCVAMNDVDYFADNSGHCGQSQCSVDDLIDYCTCMFCIKGVFYHCTKDSDGETIEDPCSCTGGARNSTARILCLGLLAFFLPCLACYLPAKGCLRLCRSCKGGKKGADKDSYYVRYRKELRRASDVEERYH